MTKALIVSHGQPSDPEIGENEIKGFARAVAQQAPDLEVTGVSLAAPGALEDAVAKAGPDAVIYPLFMADGWFTQVQLPRRLGNHDLARLPPFGTDPGLSGFAVGWLEDVLATRGWKATQTSLIVLGHGSGKSERPAQVTREFAAKVQDRLSFASLRIGFVEEPPFLNEALGNADRRTICMPFFATRRGHVREDVPRALEETAFPGQVLDPIGLHPCIPGFIAMRLYEALGLSVPRVASA